MKTTSLKWYKKLNALHQDIMFSFRQLVLASNHNICQVVMLIFSFYVFLDRFLDRHIPYTIYHIPYTIYHIPYTIYHIPSPDGFIG